MNSTTGGHVKTRRETMLALRLELCTVYSLSVLCQSSVLY